MTSEVFDELYDRVCQLHGENLISFRCEPSPLATQKADVLAFHVVSRHDGDCFHQMFNVPEDLRMDDVEDLMLALKRELDRGKGSVKLDATGSRV